MNQASQSLRCLAALAAATILSAATLAIGATPALAWDSGTEACRHDDAAGACGDRGNTHLWIVHNAIGLLADSNNGEARRIAATVSDPDCLEALESGLFDTDQRPFADGLWEPGAHFYNANGMNYFGNREGNAGTCETYEVAGICVRNSGGNGREHAQTLLSQVHDLNEPGSCYALGRTLHYVTDATQPMHASGLSAASRFPNTDVLLPRPRQSLHVLWEYWAATQHDLFPATGRWRGVGSIRAPDDLLPVISMKAWTHLAPFFAAMNISNSREGRAWSEAEFPATLPALANMLQDAYQETATYLFLALDPLVD